MVDSLAFFGHSGSRRKRGRPSEKRFSDGLPVCRNKGCALIFCRI
ncbi:carbohydrate kinase [Neisseria bacilliformis ATCC BAA-1200]|uniref:Carbohydrate kinase n=1 Tax=Neisseria bacilliformis ATCC BAA-1200 TaxID=888742 RepID=F2BF71_9NEIS|nr:carbohydrate kinase [Neisseria bacilliformis ATCC BAA-1200]